MPVVVSATSSRVSNPKTEIVDDLHTDDPRWFAVRVGHRKEKVVAKLFARDGVEHFLPLRDRPFRYKSKTGVRQIPLLGGYIFVRITAGEALLVQQQQFVFGFVKLGRERRQVQQEEIDLLRRLSTDSTLEWSVEEKLTSLDSGTPVEICRGPLAGVRGHFIKQKSKKVFVISLGGIDARLTTCEVRPGDVIPLPGVEAGQ